MNLTKILLGFEPEKKNILPAIKKINSAFGYVSEESAWKAAEYFSVPPSRIFELVSFYEELKIKKEKSIVIKICSSANCAVSGSFEIIRELENILNLKINGGFETKIKLETMSCLGRCAEGPVMVLGGKIYERVKKEDLIKILKENL